MPISQHLLARLKNNDPSLTELDLSNQIDADDEIELLVESLKTNTNLRKLAIRGMWSRAKKSCVGDMGAALLAQCENITHLDISYNNITDIGAKALAGSSAIRDLAIHGCEIGLIGFYAFLSNISLFDLHINYNDNFYRRSGKNVTNEELGKMASVAGITLPQTMDELTKHHIFSDFFSIWQQKIDNRLENNRATANQEYAARLQLKRQRENLEKTLMKVIELGDIEFLIKFIPDLPEGVNATLEDYGCSLLAYSFDVNQPAVTGFLLDHGAHLETHDRNKTLLFEAAEAGKLPFVKLLLMRGANITGEFNFNDETALSVAAFKLCHCVYMLLKNYHALIEKLPKPLQKTAAAHIEKWDTLCQSSSNPTWILFGTRDDLQYAYARAGLSLSYNLSVLKELENSEDMQKAKNYAQIYKLIHDKVAILKKKPLLFRENYFASLQGQRIYQLRPLVKATTIFQNLDRPSCEKFIVDLNKELTQQKESDIDWSKYPRFFIAQYRCIHYYSHYFNEEQREDHIQTSHLGRMGAAVAVYDMSSLSPLDHQLARESTIVENALYLRVLFQRFFETGSYQYNNKTYPSLGHYLQERMSNAYEGYKDDITQRQDVAFEILADIGAKGYPHYASSDFVDHALRYGYGMKTVGKLAPHILKANYANNGKPKNHILGKIFIGLYTPLEMSALRMRHAAGMDKRREIELGDTIRPERESGVAGGAEAGYVFYEASLEAPDFSKWEDNFLERFGIDRPKFNDFQIRLTQTKNLGGVEDEIIRYVKNHKEKQILMVAQEEAKRRGGYLIYKHYDRSYGLELEPMRPYNNRYKHEQDLANFIGVQRFGKFPHPKKRSTDTELEAPPQKKLANSFSKQQ